MNTPDIDIEALREWVRGMEDADIADGPSDFDGPSMAAARFLIDLADEGDELWRYDRCEHGADGGCFFRLDNDCGEHGMCAHHSHYCPGGSRVRVWPKETE